MTDSKYEIIDAYRIKDVNVQLLKFTVPLDHFHDENPLKINVVAKLVTKFEQLKIPTVELKWDLDLPETDSNVCVYLQGGPGFPCPAPEGLSQVNSVMHAKGFQMLYLDQRGTGFSSAIDSKKLLEFGTDEERMTYIKFFRAIDIVLDAEYIRKALIGEEKWSLLGQSYGGFCATTYLSYYPGSLNQVLITGGIPPINKGPDDVYNATYQRTEDRNRAYYEKYPGDILRVHEICDYLSSNTVSLPNGGELSVERFQATGLSFGATSGTDSLHLIVFSLHYDIKNHGKPTFATLLSIESSLSFDTNIIYFLFQEAIYVNTGMKSNWSADRLRSLSAINFDYLKLKENCSDKTSIKDAVFFTGEMVYKSMLDDFIELQPLKGLAHKLHETTEWGDKPLYQPEVLLKNQVPVSAATYFEDQYVDFQLTMSSKRYINGIRQLITNEYFHNGLREDSNKILESLLKLSQSGSVL